MIVLGLTGSIGMGKSTVSAMFRRLGVPVFDADAAVHQLYAPGGAMVAAVEALFPGSTGPGGVDRARLGPMVLGDRLRLKALEGLLHPAVGRMRERFLSRYRRRRLVVLDIPLLFEGRGRTQVDAIAVVSAPAWKQRGRVLARAGMTPAKFAQILRRQMPDREKRRRADFVIDTGVAREATARHVRHLVACLSAHGVRYCRRCARSSSIPKPRG